MAKNPTPQQPGGPQGGRRIIWSFILFLPMVDPRASNMSFDALFLSSSAFFCQQWLTGIGDPLCSWEPVHAVETCGAELPYILDHRSVTAEKIPHFLEEHFRMHKGETLLLQDAVCIRAPERKDCPATVAWGDGYFGPTAWGGIARLCDGLNAMSLALVGAWPWTALPLDCGPSRCMHVCFCGVEAYGATPA